MITYYTDGSASPNPGPGGFAVIKNGQPYMIGGEPSGEETTNIRMEGLAIKTALEDAAGEECQIYTDSEFWINVITKWAPGWEANGWKKKGGEIKNLDIVREVYPLYTASNATLTWVRGHEGDEGNELADEWANKARQKKVREPEIVASEVETTPIDHARALLEVGRTMQLATLHGSVPRVNSVYYVIDTDLTAVYWLSEPDRRHSVDITINNAVAGAVAVKADAPVRGVQFQGSAQQVNDATEIEMISKRYAQKYNGAGSNFAELHTAGTNKHVLYKMNLDTLELFDEVRYPGGSVISVF